MELCSVKSEMFGRRVGEQERHYTYVHGDRMFTADLYQIFKLFYEQFEGVGTGSRQNPGNFLQWTSGQIEKDLMTVHGSAVATDIVTTLPVDAFFMSSFPCRTYYWYFREHSWSKISQLNAQLRIFPVYIFQQDCNLRTVWLFHLLMAESGA